jgi:hypothetical protein
VVQEDDEWEESEEAWELGDAEAMIVGTVHQEVEYSWQEACDTWAARDGGTEAGIYQVEVSEVETGHGEKGQCKEANEASQGDEQLEEEGLLVDWEEREYVLELLMREIPPSQHASVRPTKAEAAVLRGKKKRNLGKKLRKRLKVARGTTTREPKKDGKANTTGGGGESGNLRPSPQPRGARQRADQQGARRKKPACSLTADLEGGVFRIARDGIFPRSSLFGAEQSGLGCGRGGVKSGANGVSLQAT